MLGLQEKGDFKAVACQQNNCSSGWTTFEWHSVPKGSSLIRKTSCYESRSHQKAFEKDPCQNTTRLAQKKKISVPTVSRMFKKIGGTSLRRFRKFLWGTSLRRFRIPLLSAAMVQKRLERSTRLLNDRKNHGNWIFIFSNKKISPLNLSSTNRMIGFFF